MSNVIFADGFNVYSPNEKAPDFVKGAVVIDIKKFKAWLASNANYIVTDNNGNDVLRMQIKESQQGKLYASVDTYQPDGVKVMAQAAREKAQMQYDPDEDSGLPF